MTGKHSIISAFNVLLVKSLAVLSGIFINIIISRLYEPNIAGKFFWSYSLIIFISAIQRFGIDKLLIKYVSIYVKNNMFENISTLFKTSIINISLIYSFSLIFFTIIKYISNSDIFYFNNTNFILLNILFLITNIKIIVSSYYQSLNNIKLSLFYWFILPSITFIILVYLFNPNDITGLLLLLIIARSISIFIALSIKSNNYVTYATIKNSNYDKYYIKIGYYIWLSIVSKLFIHQGILLISEQYISPADMSIMYNAIKISGVFMIFLQLFEVLISQKISVLYFNNDINLLRSLLSFVVFILIILTTPLFIFIIFYASEIMSLFGTFYINYDNILIMLSIIFFLNNLIGLSSSMLIMTGNEKEVAVTLFLISLISIPMSIYLLDSYNLMGGILAFCIAIFSKNIVFLFLIKLRLGIWAISFTNLRIKDNFKLVFISKI